MLDVQDKCITASWGDTVHLLVKLEGYSLEPTDKVVFAVKKNPSNSITKPVIYKEFQNLNGDSFILKLTPDEMQHPVGEYWWDLSLTTADGSRHTLNYLGLFKIVGVAHV